MPQEVMTTKEVAAYLGIADSTVYTWVEYRQIPFTKIGTLLRFPKWLIDRWLTKNATRPDETLFAEFVKLNTRYHLEQFLLAKGIRIGELTPTQLEDEIKNAIAELELEPA